MEDYFRIGNGWDEKLGDVLNSKEYLALTQKVENEYQTKTVYPPKPLIFSALKTVSYENVSVVILGQDPYHGAGQANGMAFAVSNGVRLPPSLVNIFKEIERDCAVTMPEGGTLNGWAKQGVLLLNASLTVRDSEAGSHSDYGWKLLTDAIVSACAEREKPIVFLLWGSYAGAKKAIIKPPHLVLTSAHPSPLSCYRGFIGCSHFSKTNSFLIANGMKAIDWRQVDEYNSSVDPFIRRGKIIRV